MNRIKVIEKATRYITLYHLTGNPGITKGEIQEGYATYWNMAEVYAEK
jgi:hypothetical protein